jgi:hypothetical protein
MLSLSKHEGTAMPKRDRRIEREDRMRRLVILAAVVTAVAVLALGCGRSEKTVYSGPGGKVTVEKNAKGEQQTVTFEGKEGKSTVSGGMEKTITEAELGAPVYPGAKVEMQSKMQGDKPGDSFQQHILFTKDDYDKVIAFYKANLKNVKGEQNISTSDGKMTIFSVGEGKTQMMVHIGWDAKEKRTMIQVMKAGQM